jgi:hypothetical protein
VTPLDEEAPADGFVARVKLYASTILVLSAVVTLATGFVVREVTKEVRADVKAVRAEMTGIGHAQAERAVADSMRFERVMQVVELAVIAIVEPEGSDEQRSAVSELRRRRHVTPRSITQEEYP